MRRIVVHVLFALCLVTLSCSQETSGEETVEHDTDDIVSDKELTFGEYVDALKELKPTMPIQGSHVSSFDGQLPNAPRSYRHGFHEGFDFYDGFCGVKIEEGTAVAAIADGRLVRLDTLYAEIAPAKREELLEEAKELGYTPEATQDVLRGRQVWIDHGNGIVTRYCHLSGVVAELPASVKQGMIIGFVGGSGTKSKTPHLHFEIRLGNSFFGKDMAPDDIRNVAGAIFTRNEDSP